MKNFAAAFLALGLMTVAGAGAAQASTLPAGTPQTAAIAAHQQAPAAAWSRLAMKRAWCGRAARATCRMQG